MMVRKDVMTAAQGTPESLQLLQAVRGTLCCIQKTKFLLESLEL